MKIDLCFAELHTPLFLGGTNWGLKLDIKDTRKGKLTIAYDRGEKELLVSANGKVAIIPTSNVVSMTPMSVTKDERPAGLDSEIALVVKEEIKRGKVKAQVSGPHDHVFAGQGAGKTNDKK